MAKVSEIEKVKRYRLISSEFKEVSKELKKEYKTTKVKAEAIKILAERFSVNLVTVRRALKYKGK